jgi:hypothetical protein
MSNQLLTSADSATPEAGSFVDEAPHGSLATAAAEAHALGKCPPDTRLPKWKSSLSEAGFPATPATSRVEPFLPEDELTALLSEDSHRGSTASRQDTVTALPSSAEAAPPRSLWTRVKSSLFHKLKSKQRTALIEGTLTAPVSVPGPQSVGPFQKVEMPLSVHNAQDAKSPRELPIRVLIGYLAEVSERDAREYAMGIAERNCEQISLVYIDAFRLNNGYAYEIHEGGGGKAYLPSILSRFETLKPFEKGSSEESVIINTATRKVQVDRTREGLQAFLLPESSVALASDWVTRSTKMTAALNSMTMFLVIGASLFITGFLAMTLAMFSRVQPFDSPMPPRFERATDAYSISPAAQWGAIERVSGVEYVKAVRFSNGKWVVDRGVAELGPPPVLDAAPVAGLVDKSLETTGKAP